MIENQVGGEHAEPLIINHLLFGRFCLYTADIDLGNPDAKASEYRRGYRGNKQGR